ncbi:MAG TPA: hypothetical protein VIV55_10145 [Flavobacterium sp.]
MTDILITKEEVEGIIAYLNDGIAKYSNPLLNFFNGKIQEQLKKDEVDRFNSIAQAPELPNEQPKPKRRGVGKKFRNIEVNEPENVSEGSTLNT